jgi:hypothetical protein
MRPFVLLAALMTLTPAAHAADVLKDAASLRAKVAQSYSKGALKRFDRAMRIGSPTGPATTQDLGGEGIRRFMLQDGNGHSLTTDEVAAKGYEAVYANRVQKDGKGLILRQPGVQLTKKGLVIHDTATRISSDGVATTEGSLHQERNLDGRRVESTTRYQAKVANGKLLSIRIRSDRARLVEGDKTVEQLPGEGRAVLDKIYEAAK